MVISFITQYDSIYSDYGLSKFELQASNDGSNWTTLLNETDAHTANYKKCISNHDKYLYYRLYRLRNGSDTLPYYTWFRFLQFYGRQ